MLNCFELIVSQMLRDIAVKGKDFHSNIYTHFQHFPGLDHEVLKMLAFLIMFYRIFRYFQLKTSPMSRDIICKITPLEQCITIILSNSKIDKIIVQHSHDSIKEWTEVKLSTIIWLCKLLTAVLNHAVTLLSMTQCMVAKFDYPRLLLACIRKLLLKFHDFTRENTF